MKTMTKNVYQELYERFIKAPVLRLYSLTASPSKKLLTVFGKEYLKLARIIPGADVIFLGIFLKEIKPYILYIFHLQNICGGEVWSILYDLYVSLFIIIGSVIYLTRRYILSRKRT